MRPLRERREWRDAVEGMEGGVSKKTLIDVRAEQKAPFRLFRLIIVSGIGAGALLGLLIISTRLVSAIKGRGRNLFHLGLNQSCFRGAHIPGTFLEVAGLSDSHQLSLEDFLAVALSGKQH